VEGRSRQRQQSRHQSMQWQQDSSSTRQTAQICSLCPLIIASTVAPQQHLEYMPAQLKQRIRKRQAHLQAVPKLHGAQRVQASCAFQEGVRGAWLGRQEWRSLSWGAGLRQAPDEGPATPNMPPC